MPMRQGPRGEIVLHKHKAQQTAKECCICPSLSSLFHLKDTWTKSRGRVEVGEGGGFSWGGVEGWGEKPHKCN